MDIFDEEILKFWGALQKWQVRYIMVGGDAINLHGYQRYTGDIDIWIEDIPENRRRLRQAFIECGMGDYHMLETMQFAPGWTDFNFACEVNPETAKVTNFQITPLPSHP